LSVLTVRPWWATPWPTPAQAHLLQAIFGPEPSAIAAYAAWLDTTDLTGPIDFATYRLMPMLDVRLRSLGFADEQTGRYKGIYRRSWYANTLLFAESGAVLANLAAAGIPTMMLKGAPLALLYYPEPAARPMSDIDLLVHEADFAQVEAVLTEAGWRRTSERDAAFDRHYKHSIAFTNGQREIDLHWHFLRELRSEEASRWFWQQALPFDFQGVASLRPAPGPLLFSIIVHGLRCNPASPVRWIADAIMILRQDSQAVDWDDLVAFARRQRLTRRLGLGLDFLARTFDLPIPAGLPQRLLACRAGLVERIENSIYLADPATRRASAPQRLWNAFANYAPVIGARSGPALAARLVTGLPHFLRYRRAVRRFYRAAASNRSSLQA
jgi:hypothetical protein